jgi:hypothetical protein
MREANAIQAAEATSMQKYRQRGTIEAFSESYKETKLSPLDGKYYALTENLSALRIAKIRATPSDFLGD